MINLNYGYYIEVDTYNYTLKQKYDGKTKDGQYKDAVKTCGYFGNIRRAIDKYIRLVQIDLLDEEALSLQEYVKSIELINKTAVRGLEKELSRFEVK